MGNECGYQITELEHKMGAKKRKDFACYRNFLFDMQGPSTVLLKKKKNPSKFKFSIPYATFNHKLDTM